MGRRCSHDTGIEHTSVLNLVVCWMSALSEARVRFFLLLEHRLHWIGIEITYYPCKQCQSRHRVKCLRGRASQIATDMLSGLGRVKKHQILIPLLSIYCLRLCLRSFFSGLYPVITPVHQWQPSCACSLCQQPGCLLKLPPSLHRPHLRITLVHATFFTSS